MITLFDEAGVDRLLIVWGLCKQKSVVINKNHGGVHTDVFRRNQARPSLLVSLPRAEFDLPDTLTCVPAFPRPNRGMLLYRHS